MEGRRKGLEGEREKRVGGGGGERGGEKGRRGRRRKEVEGMEWKEIDLHCDSLHHIQFSTRNYLRLEGNVLMFTGG